jgi:hypothetical protein
MDIKIEKDFFIPFLKVESLENTKLDQKVIQIVIFYPFRAISWKLETLFD